MQKNKTRGFTLIELSIVVTVIAILACAFFAGQGFVRASKLSNAQQNIRNVRHAVSSYIGRRGGELTGPPFIYLEDKQHHELSKRLFMPKLPWPVSSELTINGIFLQKFDDAPDYHLRVVLHAANGTFLEDLVDGFINVPGFLDEHYQKCLGEASIIPENPLWPYYLCFET